MRKGISITLTPEDRVRLNALIRDRNSPQKHFWRARIIVLSADGKGTNAITRAVGKGKKAVWRWQERFMHAGVDGLARDKTRPSRIPPLPAETIDRVVALTNQNPPHEATHWTAPAMAKAVGISPSSVRRIWKGHGLQPHRVRNFKLSNDPKFAEKLNDVVGLYIDPPAHAVVLSIDEKSQIQALDRTQPGLPMKKGRCATMSSALHLPFHPDLVLLGQGGRRLVCQAHPATAQTRGLQIDCRTASHHQSIHRRSQPQAQAVRLDQIRQCHPRRCQKREANVRIDPLAYPTALAERSTGSEIPPLPVTKKQLPRF
jgi:transposase